MNPESQLQQATFHIDGLDCAEEISVLRARLAGQAGVEGLNFDILRSLMILTFDARLISPDSVIKDVAATGMRAALWDPSVESSERQSRRQWPATCLSGISAALGFVIHWIHSGSLAAALGYGMLTDVQMMPIGSRLCYLLSIFGGFWFVAPKAWYALRRLHPDMNLLMCLAVAGALALDQWLEATAVTFLFALALLLEHWSVRRARQAIGSLLDLSPATARCKESSDGRVKEKPVDEVLVGETIMVRPSEHIPLDGQVSSGHTSVDQAPITGESLPVPKQPGDLVYAGTINGEASIEFKVSRRSTDTRLARMIHLVEEAQASRAPMERWVDQFARIYTPAILCLAIAIALIPPLAFRAPWNEWVYNALVMLVVACPCALVISTPVSIVSALTSAARHGVLIKGGRYLEACARLPAIAIDKTGTLTQGRPVVKQMQSFDGCNDRDLLKYAASLESHSLHPIATAITRQAEDQDIDVIPVQNYRVISGLGAEAQIRGKTCWIGGTRLLQKKLQSAAATEVTDIVVSGGSQSTVFVGDTKQVYGWIGVADAVRGEAPSVVRALRELGTMHICMITGDHEKAASAVAKDIDVDHFMAEALPEDKVEHVKSLRERYGAVAMVGDGVNDIPAMAASTLGIAMGAVGTDVAIETADIALMSDDLSKIPWLVSHARRTLRVVRENICLALGLKLIFVVLAIGGAASLWMAIAADMGASLLVILNGLRLLDAKSGRASK